MSHAKQKAEQQNRYLARDNVELSKLCHREIINQQSMKVTFSILSERVKRAKQVIDLFDLDGMSAEQRSEAASVLLNLFRAFVVSVDDATRRHVYSPFTIKTR